MKKKIHSKAKSDRCEIILRTLQLQCMVNYEIREHWNAGI
jgi:hypothetical protein